jgi:hypothetical protein
MLPCDGKVLPLNDPPSKEQTFLSMMTWKNFLQWWISWSKLGNKAKEEDTKIKMNRVYFRYCSKKTRLFSF